MKLHDRQKGDIRQSAFDLRLAARLRSIADSQRAPARLRERVYAGLAVEHLTASRRWALRWDLIGAAGAGALATAAAFSIWLATPPAQPTIEAESWVDIAMNQVTGPALVQTDQPAFLRSWFESQAGYTIDVPNIPEATLKGGRLAYVNGIQGVAVEYQIHGQELTYLMVPEGNVMDMLAEAGDTLVTWSSRGYQIVMWKQSGGTRALVGPIPSNDLYDIADHCRRTMI
jgi:anti-sigma factor RsiW